MFVEVESGTKGSGSVNSSTTELFYYISNSTKLHPAYASDIPDNHAKVTSSVSGSQSTTSAHISAFSLTSMTLTTPTPVMYQVIEFT